MGGIDVGWCACTHLCVPVDETITNRRVPLTKLFYLSTNCVPLAMPVLGGNIGNQLPFSLEITGIASGTRRDGVNAILSSPYLKNNLSDDSIAILYGLKNQLDEFFEGAIETAKKKAKNKNTCNIDDVVPTTKKKKSGLSAKEAASDTPSWARKFRPNKTESGKDFAKRVLDSKYGPGNYGTGPRSEFIKIKKWGDRAFE